jgi:hypothetical protein
MKNLLLDLDNTLAPYHRKGAERTNETLGRIETAKSRASSLYREQQHLAPGRPLRELIGPQGPERAPQALQLPPEENSEKRRLRQSGEPS